MHFIHFSTNANVDSFYSVRYSVDIGLPDVCKVKHVY